MNPGSIPRSLKQSRVGANGNLSRVVFSRFQKGPSRARHRGRVLGLLAIVVTLMAGGCSRPSDEPAPLVEVPLEGLRLKVLVVDDAALCAAAEGLRGEWTAQTGAEYEVAVCTQAELLAGEKLDADAVIGLASLIGPLAERTWIAPIPDKTLMQKQGPWPGILEVLRTRQATWGRTVYGVPFGSPLMTCYYRADLLEKIGRRPPESWKEYGELARLLADRSKLGDKAPPDDVPWCGALEPLAPGWAGLTLLARAVPAAKHRDNLTALFDFDTMAPLVAGEAFVRALEQLVAVSRHGPEKPAEYEPATVRAAFWKGQCGLAVCWPSGAKQDSLPEELPPGFEVGFLEMFGSQDVFDAATRRWETRGPGQETQVTLLDVAGRSGFVSAQSDHPDAAFQLLFWLSGEEQGAQFAAASPATTLFRESHLAAPSPWVEPPVPEAAAQQYAAEVDAALRREQYIFALRIPGRQEYLAALDQAVMAAVCGEAQPAEALEQAADQWQAITERLGIEKQQAAYQRSLGLP